MKLRGEVFQFLSRKNIPNQSLGKLKISPEQRPDIIICLSFELKDKPFEINFAQVIPKRPSVGAFEYVDPYIDRYMKERWPKCLCGSGTIEIPEGSGTLSCDLLRNILEFLRKSSWHLKENVNGVIADQDQIARHVGYRRKYVDRQIYDIKGNRRPKSSENYVPTNVGEYVGPGVASLPDISPIDNINEFVWSQIIYFPDRSSLAKDLPRIKAKALEFRKHYNGYNELIDARRHLDKGEVKACVRAGASAVDAILRFNCSQWDVCFPTKPVPFDQKIEDILALSGMPSYKAVDPENLQNLLYLYLARNKMHEGDCFYKDKLGNIVQVKTVDQCSTLLASVESFVVWVDSIV